MSGGGGEVSAEDVGGDDGLLGWRGVEVFGREERKKDGEVN